MVYTKLIIDGNAVYEIDEECMMQRRTPEKSRYEKPAAKVNREILNKRTAKQKKVNKEKRAFPNEDALFSDVRVSRSKIHQVSKHLSDFFSFDLLTLRARD